MRRAAIALFVALAPTGAVRADPPATDSVGKCVTRFEQALLAARLHVRANEPARVERRDNSVVLRIKEPSRHRSFWATVDVAPVVVGPDGWNHWQVDTVPADGWKLGTRGDVGFEGRFTAKESDRLSKLFMNAIDDCLGRVR